MAAVDHFARDYRPLEGKVAIVTGATRSMGEAIAAALTQRGAIVVGAGRDTVAGNEVASRLRSSGATVAFIRTDVGVESDVTALVSETCWQFGGVDIVVNNAASTDRVRNGEERPIAFEPMETFDALMTVGFYGPLWLAKCAIPVMIKRGGGSIINISSILAAQAAGSMGGYSISKAALEALTRQIAVDHGEQGIRCNAIRLGSIRTSNNAGLHDDPNGAVQRKALRMVPEIGHPEDVGILTAFLASDEARYITAAVVALDGGMSSKLPSHNSSQSESPSSPGE